MVLLRYDDVPGVIGRVGTLFGEAGVNIANMAVSRNREGGKALMALSIDSPAAARAARTASRKASTTHCVIDSDRSTPTDPGPSRSSVSSAVPARRGRRRRASRSSRGHADCRDAAKAVGCELAQIVKSLVLVCDGAYVLALVPGDRARRRGGDRRRGRRTRRPRRHARTRSCTRPGSSRARVAPFPRARVTQTLMERSLLAHDERLDRRRDAVAHGGACRPPSCCGSPGARVVDLAAAGSIRRRSRQPERSARCRRPRRSG